LRWAWLITGHFFFVLGFIGIFLPVLPTTPFILLAAACYSRGSERFENWLLNHPKYGPQIKEWREYRVIRPRVKAIAISCMLVALIFPMFVISLAVWIRASVFGVMLFGALFVLSCPSKRPELESTYDLPS